MGHQNSDSTSSSDWIEGAARGGYAAKGAVYATIGFLALKAALGSGEGTEDSKGAIQSIASGPFGTILLSILSLGLLGYVIWRLVQAIDDPEAEESDSSWKRARTRAFCLGSALVYAALAWFAADMIPQINLPDIPGTGGGGSGSETSSTVQKWFNRPFGLWIVASAGVAVISRGAVQLVKAYSGSFTEKIESFGLEQGKRNLLLTTGRIGLTARAAVFFTIGGSLILAVVQRDPSEARGLEGTLDTLSGQPLLLGGLGAGLFAYAVYQWVKAGYRAVGV